MYDKDAHKCVGYVPPLRLQQPQQLLHQLQLLDVLHKLATQRSTSSLSITPIQLTSKLLGSDVIEGMQATNVIYILRSVSVILVKSELLSMLANHRVE